MQVGAHYLLDCQSFSSSERPQIPHAKNVSQEPGGWPSRRREDGPAPEPSTRFRITHCGHLIQNDLHVQNFNVTPRRSDQAPTNMQDLKAGGVRVTCSRTGTARVHARPAPTARRDRPPVFTGWGPKHCKKAWLFVRPRLHRAWPRYP